MHSRSILVSMKSGSGYDRCMQYAGTRAGPLNDTLVFPRGLHLLLLGAVACCPYSSPIACAQQVAQNSSPPRENPGGIGKAKLAEKPVEVLGGRLTVRVPQGARIEASALPHHGGT